MFLYTDSLTITSIYKNVWWSDDRNLVKNALLLYHCCTLGTFCMCVCIPGSKFDANDDRSVEQNKSIDEPSKLMW